MLELDMHRYQPNISPVSQSGCDSLLYDWKESDSSFSTGILLLTKPKQMNKYPPNYVVER